MWRLAEKLQNWSVSWKSLSFKWQLLTTCKDTVLMVRVLFLRYIWLQTTKKFKPTIPIISFLMIYGLPTEQGYATLHAFRCITLASWDLIKITASKIPVKWKFREDNTLYSFMQNVSILVCGKIWVNLCFYGCRQKFTDFIFSWHLGCFLLYISWDHSLPEKEGKRKSRVKHVAENALDIIIRHYHSLAMMSSQLHKIGPCLGEVSFNEIYLFKKHNTNGKSTFHELLRLKNWHVRLLISLTDQLFIKWAAYMVRKESSQGKWESIKPITFIL